ncbi:lisH domain-containing protein, partial [Haematococcus lacustris]
MAGARGKEERLKTMQVARMEAEARAAAHAAEAEIARMQVERLQQELAGLRDDVGRRVAAAADNAEAMLSNAAGALGMLESEAHHTRSASSQLQTTLQELASVRSAAHQAAEQAAAQLSELKAVRQEAEEGQARLASMKQRLADMESMVEEALAARATALSQLDDQHFSNQQLERDLADSRAALARAREELNALHASTAAPGGLAGLLTASGTPAARAAAAPLGQVWKAGTGQRPGLTASRTLPSAGARDWGLGSYPGTASLGSPTPKQRLTPGSAHPSSSLRHTLSVPQYPAHMAYPARPGTAALASFTSPDRGRGQAGRDGHAWALPNPGAPYPAHVAYSTQPAAQPSWVSDMGGTAVGSGLGAGSRGGGPAVPPLPAAATRALEQGEPASPIKQSEASPPPAAKTMPRPHGLLEQGSRSPTHSRPATAWGAPSSALDPPLPVPLPSALQPGGASGLPRLDHTDTLALAAYQHSVPAGTAPQQHPAAALPQAPLPPHPLLNTQQAQQDQVGQGPAQQQWLAHRDGSQHWPQPQLQQWQQEQRPQASMYQPATGPVPPLPPPPAHAPPSLAPYLEPTVASVSFSDIPHPPPLPTQLAPPPASYSPQPAAATAPTILLQPTFPQPPLVTASSHPGNPTTAAPAPYPSLPGLPSTAQSHHPAQPGTAVPPLPSTTAALTPGPGIAVALLTSGSQAGSSLPAQQLGDAPAASGWAAAAGLAVSVGGSDVMGSTLGSTLPPLPPSLSPNTGARASGPPPGLMLVQDLSSTAPPALPTQPQAAESKAMVPPSLDFVRAAQ